MDLIDYFLFVLCWMRLCTDDIGMINSSKIKVDLCPVTASYIHVNIYNCEHTSTLVNSTYQVYEGE